MLNLCSDDDIASDIEINHQEGDDEVTRILQDKILAKRKLLFNPLFEKIHANFLNKDNDIEL